MRGMRHRRMVPSPGGTHHPADQPARGVPDTSGSPRALVSCHGYRGKTVPGEKLAEDARKNLPQHAAAQPEYLCIAVLHGECSAHAADRV